MKSGHKLTKPVLISLCLSLLTFVLGLVLLTKPVPPAVTASNDAASGQMALVWEAVEGASRYRIYRSSDVEPDPRPIHTTSSLEFTDASADQGRTYRYFVRAVSAFFVPSDPGNVLEGIRTLPQPVLAVTSSAASGKPKIAWEPLDGAEHYCLYRRRTGGSWTLVATTTGTRYIDAQAKTGIQYQYRLQAVAPDDAVSSAFSEAESKVCALSRPVVVLSSDAASGALRLEWKEATDAVSYEVYRAGESGSWQKLDTVQEPSFLDLTGIPETVYHYQVVAAAKNPAANSAHSLQVTDICRLPQPKFTVSNDPASGSVILSWEPVPGAAGYKLSRCAQADGTYEPLYTGTETDYTDTSGASQEIYFYQILASSQNPEADSLPTAPIQGTFLLPCPTVTGEHEPETGVVALSWNPVEGAVEYDILRTASPEEEGLWLDTTRSTTWRDYSGAIGTRYSYTVRAVAADAAATSVPSAALELFRALPSPVITVSNHSTKGRVKISWEAVSGARGYQVFRASDSEGDYRFLESTDSTLYLDTTGEAEQTYYYKVMALAEDPEADSGLSSEKAGTYRYPKKITLTAQTNSKGKPHLEWNEVKGAVKYRVFRSMMPDKGFSLLTTVTGTEYTNGTATEGVVFYYRIEGRDKNGQVVKTSNVDSAESALSGTETLKTRYVNIPKIWLYDAPDVASDSKPIRYMAKVELGKRVSSTSQANWYRCFYKDRLYYLRIEKEEDVLTSKKRKFQYTGETKRQQQIIDLALEISEEWETTYAHGQSNGVPNSKGVYGFDCTGLVKYIFGTVMQKSVPTFRLYADIDTLYETDSIYNAGYPGEFFASDVKKKNIQPGDVLFFTSLADGSDSDSIGHCGIYLGSNEFVHSTSAWSDAVCIMPLSDTYLENLVAIRRYLPKTVTPANTAVRLRKDSETYSLYSERSRKSSVITKVSGGDTVTVLFTDNADWAYVQAENGKKGFIQVQHFK